MYAQFTVEHWGILASILFAGFSLGVAALAYLESAKSNATSQRNSQRLLEIEESRHVSERMVSQKADLVASLERSPRHDGRPDDTHLVVRNMGEGTAEDIRVCINGTDVLNHPNAIDAVPLGRMTKNARWSTFFIRYRTPDDDVLRVAVTWKDDSGIPGEFESPLTYA